ncbi:hypothetical protein RSAG8_09657, partial [Rhizoctonia solani AG-8 WAC10335]
MKGQYITTVKPSAPDADVESTAAADRCVPGSKWQTDRLPSLDRSFGLLFISKKVDTVEWARKEVAESNQLRNEGRKLADDRANIGLDMNETYPHLYRAFILFSQRIGAHFATHILVHDQLIVWRRNIARSR